MNTVKYLSSLTVAVSLLGTLIGLSGCESEEARQHHLYKSAKLDSRDL
jgi:hypothetical protein